MKACLRMMTGTGWTAQQIYGYKYPNVTNIFENLMMPVGEVTPSTKVIVYPNGPVPISGVVVEVSDDGQVNVKEDGHGITHKVPAWRVVRKVENDDDLADVLGGECQMCFR